MYKKVPSGSMNITQENINVMKQLFPEALTDGGKIDFDKLKLLLGEEIHRGREKYEFTWPGKIDTIRGAQLPTKATLKLDEKSSKNIESTENLYIEGDNLEVLKALQKSYYNKVKMIYIDPPYNTGKEFVYKDDYFAKYEDFLRLTNQVSEENTRLSTNVLTSGRYHSNWLNMIYPRLKIARNLLTEDGVIFISIDDHEVGNLISVCDEIFGEENRVSQICHKSRASVSNDKIISENHNFILFYCKNKDEINKKRSLIGVAPDLNGFNYSDENGYYKLVPVDGPGGSKKGNPYYEFLGVEGYYRYSKESMKKKYKEGIIVKKGNSLYQKYYINEAKNKRKTVTTWWDDVSYTSTATQRLNLLMDGKTFDTPKPKELILKMLNMITFYDSQAIIMDFFSGSATTAHAVMKLNAEDGGNRKFIMVQLPEPTDEKSEAYKAGYSNICEIGKERIRRAGEQILEEHPEAADRLDVGFKVLKLDQSNIKEWNVTFDDLEEELDLFADTFVEGAREIDIVYEIMLKTGLELTLPIDSFEVDGKNVYDIAYGNLFVCLADGIDTTIAQAIVDKRKEYGIETSTVVFKDTGFGTNDSEKLNCFELLKDAGYQDDQLMTI